MTPISRLHRPVVLALSVIVILLVVVPRHSSAQTSGSLAVGPLVHNADGTATAPISGTAEELSALSVLVDGEPVPFSVSDGGTATASRVVFAVENSVSMTPFQLAEVQTATRALVDSLSAADEVAVVTFGGGASIALEPTTDRGALDATLAAITLDGGSALYSGVTMAGELAAGSPSSLIVLITYGWDWGAVSTHTREASIAAVDAAGAPVYVQSMVFDGSVDTAYLLPFASDGLLHGAFEIGALPTATSFLESAEPARTLAITTPALAAGSHELNVSSETGATHSASFEVTNEGLLTITATPGAEPSAPISVAVHSAMPLSAFQVSASLGGEPLTLGPDDTASIDPWSFEAGTDSFEVSLAVDGALAGSATQVVTVPALDPVLTVDQSGEETLVATLLAQPGTADTLVALVDGVLVAEDVSGTLAVARPESGSLTFDARLAGVTIASEQVSATDVVAPPAPTDPVATDPAVSGNASDPIWTSPTVIAGALAVVAVLLLLARRRSREPAVAAKNPWVTAPAAEIAHEPKLGEAPLAPAPEAPALERAESITTVEGPPAAPIAPEPAAASPAAEIPAAAPGPLPVMEDSEGWGELPSQPGVMPSSDLGPEPEVETVPQPEPRPEAVPEQQRETAPEAEAEPRAGKSRFALFERRSRPRPESADTAEWAVIVRSADGQMQRAEVGREPVSIGASKLCSITLSGDAVRFVHLVIAREGRELKAHQFGPVTVDGHEQSVEAGPVLTESVMQIGDVSIWLEPTDAATEATDAA